MTCNGQSAEFMTKSCSITVKIIIVNHIIFLTVYNNDVVVSNKYIMSGWDEVISYKVLLGGRGYS